MDAAKRPNAIHTLGIGLVIIVAFGFVVSRFVSPVGPARMSANEDAAIRRVEAIQKAQAGKPVPVRETSDGYAFQSEAATNPGTFWVVAIPMVRGRTGDRVFYASQKAGVFWLVHDGGALPRPDPRTGEPPPAARPVGGR